FQLEALVPRLAPVELPVMPAPLESPACPVVPSSPAIVSVTSSSTHTVGQEGVQEGPQMQKDLALTKQRRRRETVSVDCCCQTCPRLLPRQPRQPTTVPPQHFLIFYPHSRLRVAKNTHPSFDHSGARRHSNTSQKYRRAPL